MQPGPFTMTGEELKDVHNGLCYLRNSIRRLEDVVHPDLVNELRKNVELIEKGMKGVRQQGEAADNAARKLARDVSKELKLKHAIISLDPVNFDAVPFPKATILYYRDVSTTLPERATWKDLLRAGDELIGKSGDHHHIFIESFYEGGDEENVGDAYKGQILFMATGS